MKRILFFIGLLAAQAGIVQAGTTNFTWTGASSGTWATAGNWTVDQPSAGTANPEATGPSSTTRNQGTNDIVNFTGNAANSHTTIALSSASLQVRGMVFNSGGGNGFTFNTSGEGSGSTSFGIFLAPGGIVNNDTGTQTFNTRFLLTTFTAGTPSASTTNTFTAASGALNFTGFYGASQSSINNLAPTIDLQGGALDLNASGADITVGSANNAGIIASSGSGHIIKDGNGNLTLTGTNANTFTGGVILNAGTITAGKANVLGTGALIINNGTFNLGTFNQTVSSVTINGDATISGSGVLSTTTSLFAYNITGGNVTINTPLGGGGFGFITTSPGLVTLNGANTYTGGTAVHGPLKVGNTTGSATGPGAVTVFGNGSLSGKGFITGAVSISGGISGGNANSPGTLTIGDGSSLNALANVTLNINSASGAAGSDPGHGVIQVTGAFTLNGDSANPITIALTSLTLAGNNGLVSDFDSSSNYDWLFLHASGGITGTFTSDMFVIDRSNFANSVNGTFSVVEENGNQDLAVRYTATPVPEPSSITLGLLGGFGLMLGFIVRKNRR